MRGCGIGDANINDRAWVYIYIFIIIILLLYIIIIYILVKLYIHIYLYMSIIKTCYGMLPYFTVIYYRTNHTVWWAGFLPIHPHSNGQPHC